jgi:hypothetical protein
MNIIIRFTIFTLLALVLLPIKDASAQATDTPYQVGVVTDDLAKIDTSVVLTNSGASSTVAFPAQNGAICVNAYTMPAPGTAVTACCTCRVQPNGLRQFSVGKELLISQSSVPHTAVVKLMASTGTGGICNAGTVGTGANVLVTGMLAWRTTPPLSSVLAFDKTSFVPSTLSAAELTALDSQCSTIGSRVCNSTCP